MIKRTPLYQEHLELKARMVPFAGWEMPVQYVGVVPEHKAVRQSVGLFDVSHMGEFFLSGRGASDFLQQMTINDISKMDIGHAQYNAMCYENGTLVDDIIIYKRGFDSYFLCVNAGNIEKDFQWLQSHLPSKGVVLENLSEEYAQIAVQGPKSLEVVQKVVDIKISQLGYYRFAEGKTLGVPSIISRTGYTGELGYEIYLPQSAASKVWKGLLEAGEAFAIQPCGLGARDTLRLESAYLLYGNDMTNETTPLECGLGWITKLDKGAFVGQEALVTQKSLGLQKRLVAFEMQGSAIGRAGYRVWAEGKDIGVVTSGSPAPTLGKNIGFAYIDEGFSSLGTSLSIAIRQDQKPAVVVKRPFYKSVSIS